MSKAFDIENVHPAGNVFAEPSIFRVPERLRHVNDKAYTPQAVSIGPFHHGKEGLIVTEESKDEYLHNLDLFNSEAIVWGHEARLRKCYADTIDEQFSDDFVTMIVKDARFIIEVLLRYHFPKLRHDNDSMLAEPILSQLRRDMGLLENQLPFFILEKLFEPESIAGLSPSDREGLSVVRLCYYFFKPLMHIDKKTEGDLEDIICSSRPQHFVDLLRSFYVRDHDLQAEAKGKLRTVPSVRELQQGDVKFEVLTSSNNLFDMKFVADTKILKIPKLTISHETELTIRNVLAYEQCHRTLAENYMTDYVVFMDRFMSTQEDVKLLVEKKAVKIMIPKDSAGIISSKGSAKDLIKNLTEGVIVDPNSFYFAELCQNVDKYCRSPKVLQKTIAIIGLLLSVTANILQAIICQKKNCRWSNGDGSSSK